MVLIKFRLKKKIGFSSFKLPPSKVEIQLETMSHDMKRMTQCFPQKVNPVTSSSESSDIAKRYFST